jgi:hypothetical protein
MPRFSLRTLIVVMLLGGPVCAWVIAPIAHDLWLLKHRNLPAYFDRRDDYVNVSVDGTGLQWKTVPAKPFSPVARLIDELTPWWKAAEPQITTGTLP